MKRASLVALDTQLSIYLSIQVLPLVDYLAEARKLAEVEGVLSASLPAPPCTPHWAAGNSNRFMSTASMAPHLSLLYSFREC